MYVCMYVCIYKGMTIFLYWRPLVYVYMYICMYEFIWFWFMYSYILCMYVVYVNSADLQQLPVFLGQDVLRLAPIAEATDQSSHRLVILPQPLHLHTYIHTYIHSFIHSNCKDDFLRDTQNCLTYVSREASSWIPPSIASVRSTILHLYTYIHTLCFKCFINLSVHTYIYSNLAWSFFPPSWRSLAAALWWWPSPWPARSRSPVC